jgi:hypothetical protein
MFRKEILDFARSLDALRDFVDLIDPILDEKHSEVIKRNSSALAPLLLAMKKSNPELFSKFDISDELIKKFDGDIEILEEEDGVDSNETKSVKIRVTGNAEGFKHAVENLAKSDKRKKLLYQSSLITLTNTVEWFLSQILHQYFNKYTDAVGTKDKFFSLEDLKAFASIEDAKKHLVDTKVENILRDSFDDWISFLKEKVKLSMGYLNTEKDKIVEIYQRRNIVVHNGGKINYIYLSKVSEELRKDKSVNDEIFITRDYLDQSISLFERIFILIAAELWKNQLPTDNKRSETLIELAFSYLLKERWRIAEGLSFFVMNDKQLSEKNQLFGKLNYWQSVKWQGRFNEVKDDIEKADFSGKDSLIRLGYFALLDRTDDFFNLLPEVINSESISYDSLDIFPIFREIRKDERYIEFKEENMDKFSEPKENANDSNDEGELALTQ